MKLLLTVWWFVGMVHCAFAQEGIVMTKVTSPDEGADVLGFKSEKKSQAKRSGAPAIPVVELFTSEGCSSCPAADELLKKMSDARSNEGRPFYALSFHVTYWNRLGWLDSFSNEAYTERHKLYKTRLNFPQVYTPQALVNGEMEFVGSDPAAFGDALVRMENRKEAYTITARGIRTEQGITVSYKLNKEPKNELLNIAIVEKNRERKIYRGENKNRTLKHFNVVRDFTTLELKKQGTVLFKDIENLSSDNMEVVLYVQQARTMKIISAIKIPSQLIETN